jgi:hypothetical protein
VRWWGATRRKAATSRRRRQIAERGGGDRGIRRGVVSGRVSVSMRVYIVLRWMGDRARVGVPQRTRERASNRGGIHPANSGRRDSGIKRGLIRLKRRTVLSTIAQTVR